MGLTCLEADLSKHSEPLLYSLSPFTIMPTPQVSENMVKLRKFTESLTKYFKNSSSTDPPTEAS
jgi:hypothetical protein